jgi:hypothetical protein
MEGRSVLTEALGIVRRFLKEQGFSARGTAFRRTCEDGNTIVLSLQKSVKSSPREALVTINYGVYSARIASKFPNDSPPGFDVAAAHWRKRLSEDGREKWLQVRETDSPAESARTMLRCLEGVLVQLEEHSTDQALRDEWFTGSSPGIGKMQRMLFLAILVKEIGPPERLEEVVEDLRTFVSGTVHEALVERQLAEAGIGVG